AHFLASSRNLNKAAQHLGLTEGLLSPEEASAYRLPQSAQQYIDSLKPAYVDGTPEQVKSRLVELAGRYGTSDIGIVTTCYAYEAREQSYRLIAEAFGTSQGQ
ncbi:MAG: LLM class flavin-dependent oxidoreductase, partial [Chloroflexi bacterium]|nr:LLM class flavin-dependent oxidoreductase [Chloroflexota bacterium]